MQRHRPHRQPRGSALLVGLSMVAVLAALAISFSTRMTSNQLRTASDVAGVHSYELAQTANALKIQQVWSVFKQQPTNQRIAWVGGEDSNGNGVIDQGEDVNSNGRLDAAHAPDFQDTQWISAPPGDTCTRIKVLSLYRHDWALVRFTTWGRVMDEIRSRYVVRKIQRVVRFELGPASAFDYAYFANNYASISGKNLSIYGSVGANGNVTLNDQPLIDGTIFAATNAEIGALGTVAGTARNDSLSDYQTLASNNPDMRPTNPTATPEDKNKNGKLDIDEDTNGNGKLDNFSYIMGYDGTQTTKTMQDQEVMPDFGDLSYYRDLAQSFVRPARPDLGEAGGTTGGIVKQLTTAGADPTNPANYTTLIDGSYGSNGENGFETDVSGGGAITHTTFPRKVDNSLQTTKNGNVALIGTAAQPLVILGPVVISNDLVIKGVMTGQGTFYTGRNTHVVGDLTYANGPQWLQNDNHFDTTASTNKTKDIVGFGVAGNVVFGDYTNADSHSDQWNTVTGMLKPPYTRAQNLHFSLLDLLFGLLNQQNGYNNALGSFNGDYTSLDGGRIYNNDGSVPLFPNKAFYQSSFPKSYIHSIATNNPQNVHGIFYTYHFFGGRLQNLKLFGAMVARDEAIVSDNSGAFYYDPRISKQEAATYINLFLPRTSALYVVICKEPGDDDAVPTSPDW